MKLTYLFLITLLLLMGTEVGKAQNPYADGTTIPAGTNISQQWSIAVGTSVTGAGNFNSRADGTIRGIFTVNGNYMNDGWTGDDIVNGATLEIFGDLYSYQKIRVLEGGTLIVHGNYYDYGGSTSYIHGNVVVLGDIDFRGVQLYPTGKLVVGGDIRIRNAGGGYWGDVYALDPDANINAFPGLISSGDIGDVDDLLNDPDNTDIVDVAAGVGLVSSVDAPEGFTYTSLTGSNVDLQWSLNGSSDSVMIAWSESDLADKPVKGANYEAGETLSAGAEVVYKGKLVDWSFNRLTPGVTSYFRIWSFTSPANEFSRAVKLEVKALSTKLIFYEDFESDNTKGWGLGNNNWSGNRWFIGEAEAYNGSASAYVTVDNGSTASYNTSRSSTIYLQQDITIPSTYKSAELSFYWKGIAEDGYDGGSVRENKNARLIADISLSNQETWVEEVVDITNYINSKFDLDFRWFNDGNAGQNPGFCIDDVRIIGSEVARPQSFSGNAQSAIQVDLSWQKSTDNDNVVIAYSPFGSVGRPETGKSYVVGDYLNGGGQVIYIGSGTSYAHIGSFMGQLKYTAWSVKGSTYSSGRSVNVKIPVALPYLEDFEGDVAEWNFNSGYDNAWVRGKATAQAGTQAAYISNDYGVTAGFDGASSSDTYLELEVDLRNFETASLSFDWKCDGSYDDFGAVYLDNTMLNGAGTTNSNRYYDKTSWRSETISLSSYTDGIHTLRFRWDNNTWGSADNPGFCIDNVKITGTIANPNNFVAANPDDLLNNLSWDKNAFDDDVMVAWSSDGTFGSPEEGVVYKVGDVLPGGGKILYLGDLLNSEHSPLNYGTIYYYKAWSMRNGIYSSGIEKSASTPAKVPVLSEDWEDTSFPEWTISHVSGSNNWLMGGISTASGGSEKSAYIRTDNSTVAAYNTNSTSESWIEVDIDLRELKVATLSFDWKCEGELWSGTVYDYGEVYINNGGGDVRLGGIKEFYGNSAWVERSFDLSAHVGSNATLKFKWVNDNTSGGPLGFCIDNIEVGGIYDPSSIVDNGVRLVSEIASTVKDQASAVALFSFDLTDKSSSYNDITRIQQLNVSKGGANTIADWSHALAGAYLYGPDLPDAGLAGVISSSGITFTGVDVIQLQTENIAETYTLKVWLKDKLNEQAIEDGDIFDFVVTGSDIITGLGDDFIGVNQAQSGAIPIQVLATELRFSQQPSAFANINSVLSQVAIISATDINGNIDIDYNTDVVLTNDDGLAGSLNMTNATVGPVSGVSTFTNLTFTETGTVTLSATSGSLISTPSNQIRIDSYWIPLHSNNSAYIHKVEINTINNTSGKYPEVYASYLDQETSLTIGADYDVTVVVNNNNANSRYVFVWIDWDGNGDFETDERLLVKSTATSGLVILNGTIKVPSNLDAKVGTTRMRVQFIRDSNPEDTSTKNGESEDYTVILTTEGWKGQNNVWNVAQNWTSGSVPDIYTDVYIPESPFFGKIFPLITGDANMKDVEIANNASLTIKPGASVDITGDIINNGELIIENTNSLPASVIYSGTTDENVSVNWTYDNSRWWLIGHAISNAQMASYNALTPANDYAMYDYQDPAVMKRISKTGFNFSLQDEIRGYLLKVKNSGAQVTHTGPLNKDAVYSKSLQTDWQVIGNPYASYYQLPTESGGGTDFEHTTGSVYVTISSSNQDKTFETFNTLTGIGSPVTFTGIVAPSQGFYVKTSSAGDVYMRAAHRIHDGTKTSLKSGRSENQDVLRVKLSNTSQLTDEAVVALRPDGSKEFTRMDSEQRFQSGNSISYIYSLLDDKKVVINVLPEAVDGHQVDLGIKAKAGEHKVRITGLEDLVDTYEMVLEDKLLEISTVMTAETEYAFTSEEGDFDNRLVLHFNKIQVPTDIEDVETGKDEAGVNIYIQDESTLNVNCDWEDNLKKVRVYSISGQLILDKEFNGKVFVDQLPCKTGVYIVTIEGENKTYEQKVFIK